MYVHLFLLEVKYVYMGRLLRVRCAHMVQLLSVETQDSRICTCIAIICNNWQVRIDQLFNIIVEYPESEPALIDLKLCLEKINLRTQLVTSLKTALETRLLHPGSDLFDT